MLLSDPPIRAPKMSWADSLYEGGKRKRYTEHGLAISNCKEIRCGELRDKLAKVHMMDLKLLGPCISDSEMLWHMPKTVDWLTGWESLKMLQAQGQERKKRCVNVKIRREYLG